jgi:hypothetical protein
LGIYLLGRKFCFPRWKALLATTASGLIPGLTMIHLESFFSQALAIPFFIIWPHILSEWLKSPTFRNHLKAALLLAGATAIYTEFLLIFLLIAFVFLGYHFYFCKKSMSRFSILFVIFLGFLMNIGFSTGIIKILNRLTQVSVNLIAIYPWADSFEGIQRLWMGDFPHIYSPSLKLLCIMISLLLLAISLKGFIQQVFTNRSGFSFAVLVIVLLPLGIFLGGAPYRYQFYKMLLSVSPLFPLGIFLGIPLTVQKLSFTSHLKNLSGKLIICVLISLTLSSTVDMVWRSAMGKTPDEIGRGGAFKLIDSSSIDLQEFLTNLKRKTILILWRDNFFEGNYINGWLAYFARHNTVWVGNHFMGGSTNLDFYPMTNRMPPIPPGETYLVTAPLFSRSVLGSDVQLHWLRGSYTVWKISGSSWVSITNMINPNGLEWIGDADFFWLGTSDTLIEVLSGCSGILTLTAKTLPGPSLPNSESRHILITADGGYRQQKLLQSDENLLVSLPIRAGQSQIKIRSLDQPSVHRLPNGDPRPLLLQVRHLKISDFIPNGN